MQSVTSQYIEKVKAPIRHLTWQLSFSFDKNFDESIDFFTVGSSSIGGTDILRGINSVIQEWDKYDYEDFSNRVISIETHREMEPPIGNMTLSMADIVLDNHDDLFTPTNRSGRLYGKIGNGRPVRLYLGFQGVEKIQMFIGITEGMPDIDEKSKTVRFHCIDFLRKLKNTDLNEELMYVNKRSDEVVSAILQTAGLITSQFNLDVGSTVIPFAYFKKGSKVGDALSEIVEAELGAIYMDENGVIRMENRTNWATKSQVWSLDQSNVLDISSPNVDTVINSVEVFSQARQLQPKQKLWESNGVVVFSGNVDSIGPGETRETFIDFRDEYGELPVVSVDDPVYIASATTSLFATNANRDGSGETLAAFVTLVNIDIFSTGMKLEFSNSGTLPVFITQLEIWGIPAKVGNDIYVKETDQASIQEYEEQTHTVENNYIQDEAAATSIARLIIEDRAEIDDQRTMLIKGIPQLQVGDFVGYKDRLSHETYFVTKISGILNENGYRQSILVSKRTIRQYFRIGISTIGGTDVLAP